jgi:hypothetical protein
MKPAFFLAIIMLIAWSCSPVKNTPKTSAIVEKSSQDSTLYELVIIDNHFEKWYLLNYSDAKDRSDEYYRSKNLYAVSNWNEYYREGKYAEVIDSYVNYQPEIDYGIELNRKLYWYFKFVEEYYKIKLFW